MKKFLEEFKAFALKGNVLDLAVAVIIGGAFTGVVTSLTENLLQPVIDWFFNIFSMIKHHSFYAPQMGFAAFIASVINFLLLALIVFLIVKAVNKAMQIGKKEEEKPVTTKTCPYCYSEINIKATKCPHCASELPKEK